MTHPPLDSVGRWLEAAGSQPLLTPAEEIHLGGLIRAWQDHPAGPADAPAAIRRRGLRARDRMVAGNLRLIPGVALKLGHGGLDREDALQAGAIGLQRGAERFDPARGYKFSTFAYWWIRQAISREGHASSRTIRLPYGLAAKACQVDKRRVALAAELGRVPTTAEVAEAVGLSVRELQELALRGMGCASLDQPSGDDSATALVALVSAEWTPEDDDLEELRARLALLPPRLRRLTMALHGIDGPAATVAELAVQEGITPRRLRQLLGKAERLLKRELLQADEVRQFSLRLDSPSADP